ncbi:MAG: molybdopterin molybdotransferase MoeA [Planctomycetes bacterium]|nr:molybdopterin molybdotransferase MoeA [Planctomycetota bacterium]
MSSEPCDQGREGRPLLPLDEARSLLLGAVKPLAQDSESIALEQASGRVLAKAVLLDRAEPPVPRSAMDGFALRSADGVEDRELLGVMYAGTSGRPEIGSGQAIEVMTGGTVAVGADAVIPVEQAEVVDGCLVVSAAVRAGQHVRIAGEMGAAGEIVVPKGKVLSASMLATAASCGADPVQVYVAPRATVLSTGDEVVAWTKQPKEHQVRDANRLATALQLRSAGAEVLGMHCVLDQPELLREAVTAALASSDLVVTIGGVSMGKKDHLPMVFEDLGIEKLFHGIAVQPGKPVWVGTREGKWVVGLPGNPVSSFVMTELIVRELVYRLAGADPVADLPLQACVLTSPVRTRGRERFFPAKIEFDVDGLPRVTPDAGRGSGDWTVLSRMQALLRVPAHADLEAGSTAQYLPIKC